MDKERFKQLTTGALETINDLAFRGRDLEENADRIRQLRGIIGAMWQVVNAPEPQAPLTKKSTKRGKHV